MIATINKKAKAPDLIFQPKPLLHHYFRETVERTPTKAAIVCGDSQLTYQALEEESNRLAHHLRSLGCKPGVMVAIYLKRTINPYIAMLATVKAGGAYVPLDPMFPKDRVDYILTDANVHIVVTECELALKQQIRAPHVVIMDSEREKINAHDAQSLEDATLVSDHPAYAIYTSGSTGRPKGVLVEHQAATHFVAAMLEVYGVTSEDRTYQGFSHCFDASVEEIWLSFATGATMYVGTDEVHKSAEAVAEFIDRNKVTFFSTVPTFLSAMASPLDSIKTLVLGGESLHQDLVDKWAIPGRKMLNTYGPTEATVVATAAVCKQGEPVSIGQPLPNYCTYVLDSDLKTVPQGCEGELCISGPILARGYIGKQELTDKTFVPNPYKQRASEARLYRSGDLVRINAVGNIEFIGRIDSQVKIRGYRVELAEIETVINSVDEVQASVVRVVEIDGIQAIAAYVKCIDSAEHLNRSKMRDLLRGTLPKYMVPTYLEELEEIPVLPSGKTDYKSLLPPVNKLTNSNRELVKPFTELEHKLFDVGAKLFNTEDISIHDDFFDDIGGHSLLAANYAGNIRYELGYECMSIRDVFEYPTIALLADELSGREVTEFDAVAEDTISKAEEQYNALSAFAKFAVPALQAVTIFGIYALFSTLLSMVYTKVTGFIDGIVSLSQLGGLIATLLVLTYPCLLLLAIAAKWLLIGRYKAGEYRLWSWFYLRWWVSTRFLKMSGSQLLCGSPLLNVFYRLMGAKIGENVCLDTSASVAFDLISVGADSSVCGDSHILGYRVEDGLLKIGSVSIGERCFVGIHSAMGLDSQLEDDCRLEDFTAIDDCQVVTKGSQMSGSPAVPSTVTLPTETVLKPTKLKKISALLFSLIAIYSFFSIFSLFGLAVIVAGILTYLQWGFGGTLTMLFLGAPFILFASSMVVVVVKRCLSPKSKPGIYQLNSVLYYRKWFVDLFIKTHRTLFIPMYATLFLPPFLRLLGAKLGERCELSTIAQISPDLIEAGDECFYADAAIIGGKRIYGGYFQIDTCRIGNRSFVGNSAMLPIGADIGDECLVGCLTLPPKKNHSGDALSGQKWLGSPPILLSNTQTFDGFSEEELYRPSRATYAQRYIVDSIRILLPTYLASLGIVIACFILWQLPQYVIGLAYFLLLPLCMLSITALFLLVVIGLKQIIVGTYIPIVKPLWNPYVWFNEVVNALYEAIYTPSITLFCGTPFISPLLRGMGCRMGKRVYIDSTYFSEFDLAEINDFVAINLGSTIQTHLFEDRVMKSSYLKIRKGASIGNMSVVLYDTDIKEGVKIKPFSLVMKGETLPARSIWGGVPIKNRSRQK